MAPTSALALSLGFQAFMVGMLAAAWSVFHK